MKSLTTRYGNIQVPNNDLIATALELYGEWSSAEADVITDFINENDVVLDIGAHVGTFSLQFSDIVGPKGSVFCFEAAKENYNLLNLNTAKKENVRTFNIALGSKVDVGWYILNKLNNGASKVSGRPFINSSKTDIHMIDDYCFPKVHLMKIDVEGMEYDVLCGAQKTISQSRSLIWLELNSVKAGNKILEWANDTGYKVFGHLAPSYNRENFNKNSVDIFGEAMECSLLLVPAEKENEVSVSITRHNLYPLESVDHLAHLLFLKPQYWAETLNVDDTPPLLLLNNVQNIAQKSLMDEERNFELQVEYEANRRAQYLTRILRHENRKLELEKKKLIERLETITISELKMKSLVIIRAKLSKKFGRYLIGRYFLKTVSAIQLYGIKMTLKLIARKLKKHYLLKRYTKSELLGQEFSEIISLENNAGDVVVTDKLFAIHLHIHYSDVLDDFYEALSLIEIPFDMFISCSSEFNVEEAKAEIISNKNCKSVTYEYTVNRGRDIAPLVLNFANRLSEYDVFLHLHTKKSTHNSKLAGWRHYLLTSLIPNNKHLKKIINVFQTKPEIGIISPTSYVNIREHLKLGDNLDGIIYLSTLLRLSSRRIISQPFAAGSMFYARGEILKNFVDSGLDLSKFEPEQNQDDGTLAHAIERIWPILNSKQNRKIKFFSLEKDAKKNKGIIPVTFMSSSDKVAHLLLIDHNFGGGANKFSLNLLEDTLTAGKSVIRCFFSDGIYQIERTNNVGKRFFYTNCFKEFKLLLSELKFQIININSLMGFPNSLDTCLFFTDLISNNRNIKSVYYVHDYFCICPSQHLLSYKNKYCGVPRDLDNCNSCLSINPSTKHEFVNTDNIQSWRQTFISLFSELNEIRVFDNSSLEILDRAGFGKLPNINVLPHNYNGFSGKKLTTDKTRFSIGIIGTVTEIKGASVIRDLANHFITNRLKGEIHIFGECHCEMPDFVKIHGRYEKNELPDKIINIGINVVFLPSIVPETYSFCAQEVISLDLPLAMFNLGAQISRLSDYKKGVLIDVNAEPSEIYETLRQLNAVS